MVRPSARDAIDRVGADEMAGARHVLHHEGRARQIFLHVLGDQPAVEVVAAARRGRDDVGDGLALEEVRAALRLRRHGDRRPPSGRRRATATLPSLMRASDMVTSRSNTRPRPAHAIGSSPEMSGASRASRKAEPCQTDDRSVMKPGVQRHLAAPSRTARYIASAPSAAVDQRVAPARAGLEAQEGDQENRHRDAEAEQQDAGDQAEEIAPDDDLAAHPLALRRACSR